MIETFDARGIALVSVTQQFNTTSSMGRLTLNVLLSFAQFEREVTAERIRDKFAASKRKGLWMGGRVPLGYDLKERELRVNPAEATLVRSLYERYLALGCVSKLRTALMAQGMVSKRRLSRRGVASGGVPYSRGAPFRWNQQEDYRIAFVLVGVEHDNAQHGWLFGAGVKYPVWTQEDAHFTDLCFDQNPTLKPGKDLSGFAQLGYRFDVHWSVLGYVDGYRFKQSNTVFVTSGGMPQSGFVQPATGTYVFGVVGHYTF